MRFIDTSTWPSFVAPLRAKGGRGKALSILSAGAFLLLTVFFGDALSFAADPPEGEEPVIIHALALERKTEEKLIIGDGAVDIRHGSLRLRADHVVLNEETKDLVADGNVILEDLQDRLQGEHLELNLETRIGFVEDGQGFAQSYYFAGERIEKLGNNRYRVLDGSFTSCEGTRPDWKFRSPDTSLRIDHYLKTKHPSMWVRKVPVLYLPYAVFPVKRDRATGLLMPELRLNEIDGWTVKNYFFWAPVDNFDATVGVDYIENLGWGLNLESRYITAPGTFGHFNGSYLNSDDEGENRWRVMYGHQHDLPLGVRGQFDLYLLSDRSYTRRFDDEIETQSLDKTISSFYLSRSWSTYDVVVSGQHEESLLTELESTMTRFPEITVDRTSSGIYDTGLFWKLSLEAARLRLEEEREEVVAGNLPPTEGGEGAADSGGTVVDMLETNRVHLFSELSWPYSLGLWGSLTPALSFRETLYSEGLDGESVSRGVPTFELALEGPRLYRVFEGSTTPGEVEKYKHLVEPRIRYSYTPRKNQENIPQFDSVDIVSSENTIEYSLTNTLFGKITLPSRKAGKVGKKGDKGEDDDGVDSAVDSGEGGESGIAASAEDAGVSGEDVEGGDVDHVTQPRIRTNELIRVKLSQSYTFDPSDEGTVAQEKLSPLAWDAVARPTAKTDLRWRGAYDFSESEVDFQKLSLTWRPQPRTTLRGEWRSAAGGLSDYVDFWIRYGIKKWDLEGRSRYRIDDEEFVENKAGVHYTSQCWDIRVEYVQWPDEYEVRLQFGLKEIGTILTM